MKKILIDLESSQYDVYIGDVISYLPSLVNDKKVFVITDENVKNYHLETLEKVIKYDNLFVLGKDTESCKNLQYYELCLRYALDNYLDKNTLVIAFGGGSVTDFAGFFASTYKRGLDIILLPTTLLSHDSAIGGKTGLNYGAIKNVVGTFYQPQAVIFHLPFLKTLPKKEILSGFGEILKHDLLADGYLINEVLIQKKLDKLIFDEKLMEEIIYRAIIVKKLYIEMDVYEKKGKRQYLNFGHTLGHGLEIINQLSHGEAISLGMCFDMFIASNDYYLPFYQQLKNWGYFINKISLNIDEVVKIIKNDKKNQHGKIKFIGLEKVGNPSEITLTSEQLKGKLREFSRLVL